MLGESIPHEVLENAIESTGGDVATNLRLLAQRGLLVAGAERYDFRHAILRESVLREMLHSEQTAAHRAAVQGVRASRRDGSPAGLAQLAHHLVAAGEYVDALPTVLAAADHARSVYAFAEARRQLAVARELLWNRVDDPEAAQRAVGRGPGPSRGRDGPVGGAAVRSGHSSSDAALAAVPVSRTGPRAAGARAGRGAVGCWGPGSSARGL